MRDKINLLIHLFKNMGLRYVVFRVKYEILTKIGIKKIQYSTKNTATNHFSLLEWKQSSTNFFFESKDKLKLQKQPNHIINSEFQNIKKGRYIFFYSEVIALGQNYDWISNPINNYKYNINKHWSEIEDYSNVAGDIKYVWEKSRFSYIYSIIRYDYHFEKDQSEFVLSEILSWINANPVNQGPNWKCSQEISIRLLNWTFALHYYKNSSYLTDSIFQTIMTSIYWQTKHVYKNIDFSRIAVRNNHAISETLGLYVIGLLYPFFPDAEKWKKDGKRWFEEEIDYQIYEDGTYLQYSMNYNRVIVQLLSWALYIAKVNNEVFSEAVYNKSKETLNFLLASQDSKSGWLPNYGANDGSLYFKLNNLNFRDFRPQLNALFYFFNNSHLYEQKEIWEDCFWLSDSVKENVSPINSESQNRINCFNIGGYYIINEESIKTFVRCGQHIHRPSQADNLHLDIWVNGENIMRDAGTYRYNGNNEMEMFFNGTSSHNTIMLGPNDQMKKGPRFIWYNWTQKIEAKIEESETFYQFRGKINAFMHLGKGIYHERVVKKYKNHLHWEIIDSVTHNTEFPIVQIWNPSPTFFDNYSIESTTGDSKKIIPINRTCWYSSNYGVMEEAKQIVFETDAKIIKTIITNINK